MAMASRWSQQAPSSARADDSPDSPISPGAKTQAPSEHSSSAWQEPPALDDSCVKYILSVMVLFMRQTATAEVPLMLQTRSTDIAFRDYDETDAAASAAEPPPPPPPPAEDATLLRARGRRRPIRASMHLPAANTVYEKTHVSFIRSATAINNLIAKYVAQGVVSAFWIVFWVLMMSFGCESRGKTVVFAAEIA
ncbi:hypothetical protein BJ912DRAFT_1002251 [Pholiota molesta]|nr:hypothetical protein BJ912DRAFT_1002251 [Pholiota molesta]